MGKFNVMLTLKQAKKKRLKIYSDEPKGIFLWIGGCNVVDWTVGYHKKRGFEASRHYGCPFWKSLWLAITHKDGFITLTRFL